MAWYDSVVGVVSKHVLPVVTKHVGQVVGGAAGMVVGGPLGAAAGAAAGSAVSDALGGAIRGKKKRRPAAAPARRAPSRGSSRRTRRRSRVLSRGRHKVRVHDARIDFTIDGDRRRKSRQMRRRSKGRVPSMVVPKGSEKGAALATAGRLIASAQSADPTLAKYSKAVMNATAKRARRGSKSAQRAVSLLKTAQSANRSSARVTGFLVTNEGRVFIGSFLQTG